MLYIDTDVVALARLDWARTQRAPAFVFDPNYGMNSGVMLLHAHSHGELEQAWRLYRGLNPWADTALTQTHGMHADGALLDHNKGK